MAGTRALSCLTVKLLPDRGRRGGRRRVRQQELGARLSVRGCSRQRREFNEAVEKNTTSAQRRRSVRAHNRNQFDPPAAGARRTNGLGPQRQTGLSSSGDSWEGLEPTEPIAHAHTPPQRARATPARNASCAKARRTNDLWPRRQTGLSSSGDSWEGHEPTEQIAHAQTPMQRARATPARNASCAEARRTNGPRAHKRRSVRVSTRPAT